MRRFSEKIGAISILFISLIFFLVVFGVASCEHDKTFEGDRKIDDDDDDDNDDDSDDTDDDVDDDDGDDDDDDDDTVPACEIIDVSLENPPDANPLSREILVRTDVPCSLSGYIESEALPGKGLSSPEVSEEATQHRFWFYGLAGDTAFNYAFHQPEQPQILLSSGSFQTDPLPGWTHLPEDLQLEEGRYSNDWIVVTTAVQVLVLDRLGNIRFLHFVPDVSVFWTTMGMLKVMPNSEVILAENNGVFRIGLNGEEKFQYEIQTQEPYLDPYHHHIHWKDDLSSALVIFNQLGPALECDMITPTEKGVGDGVAEINASGEEVWRWSVFDHPDEIPPSALDPITCTTFYGFFGEGTVNFTHANSVYPDPNENAFVLSLRNLDRVVKINRETGDIIWQLGEGLDFALQGGEWFTRQHDAKILPNGNVLVFDNHGFGSLPLWSRALEIAINESDYTAEIIWEHQVSPSPVLGTVERMENGNTLISNGVGGNIIETDPDSERVWSVHITGTVDVCRALPYPPLWIDE